MILLSISPFIFIQCGSGVHFDGRRFHTGKAHRGSPVRLLGSIWLVFSEISPPRRIRRLFALPQHLPQSRHRAAELFLAAGVSRHQPKKYSKRS